jgi:dephospho-CoA kinase
MKFLPNVEIILSPESQTNNKSRVTIGITGNIGSGKSTVTSILGGYGFGVIDADYLGKLVVDKSTTFQKWLRQRYGDHIFTDGILDRSALGRIVFRDKKARDDLNMEIWPYISDLLDSNISDIRLSGKTPVVDAAMIFERNNLDRYDIIISVVADPILAAKRAAKRMNLTFDEIMDRYKMQLPVEEKVSRADIVIWNEGNLSELEESVSKIFKEKLSIYL